jgi:hypothetical protein
MTSDAGSTARIPGWAACPPVPPAGAVWAGRAGCVDDPEAAGGVIGCVAEPAGGGVVGGVVWATARLVRAPRAQAVRRRRLDIGDSIRSS